MKATIWHNPRCAKSRKALAEAEPAAILTAMTADPALIERPLVETDKGVCLARPAERLHAIL